VPVRRRIARLQEADPDPADRWTWASGDGCRPYSGPAFQNEAAARRAWNAVGRRAAWSYTPIGRVPPAATHYDAITNRGQVAALQFWLQEVFRTTVVIDAINGDRQSVADFRSKQPASANSIATYLDRYVASLAELEEDARAMEGTKPEQRYKLGPYRFKGYYGGDTARGAIDEV
jgi:hypothetical protein